jgi:hypothetical protein
VLAALRRFRLVEYHHLGDEGFHFTDVCQAANSCDFAKVLSRVADIIRPVIILREKVEHSPKTVRRTSGGNSWNMKMLVTTSKLASVADQEVDPRPPAEVTLCVSDVRLRQVEAQ